MIDLFHSMATRKYKTSTLPGMLAMSLLALAFGIAIFGSPRGFAVDGVTVLLALILIYGLFDVLFGTYVILDDNGIVRVDNFVMKHGVAVADIDVIRYQPTYLVGKELSSIYIFKRNQDVAALTLTSLWFTESVLREIVERLRRANPEIHLDDEA